MQVKASQAISIITKYLKAGLVPMMTGSPGIGKSDIVRTIAASYNLKVIDFRLGQCDPTDLLGFPNIKGNKAGYVPMETFPIEGDPLPEGYSGWLLFMDEFNSGSNAVQAAAYKIILDKMVGVDNLHSKVGIVCAGNLETDNAIVNPMSTALQSRMVHLELLVDAEEFINHANSEGYDHRITSYIGFKPKNVYTFTPDHTDKTYCCPRTLGFLNKILKVVDDDSKDLLPMMAGAVSEGIAREMLGYFKIYKDLPTITDIRNNPKGITVPIEPSILFALTGSIAHKADKDNMNDLIEFIYRLPKEFQVVCLKETVRRNKSLLTHPAIQKWISTGAIELF